MDIKEKEYQNILKRLKDEDHLDYNNFLTHKIGVMPHLLLYNEYYNLEKTLPEWQKPKIMKLDDFNSLTLVIVEDKIIKENNKKVISQDIKKEVCSRCGSEKVVVEWKDGKFLGCPNFPQCK